MIDYLSSPGLGGGGEPRHRTLPGVLQGSVPGVRAAARRRALHPGATLALRALAGAKLLRQLLVVLIWANDRKMKLGDSYVQYFWFQHFFFLYSLCRLIALNLLIRQISSGGRICITHANEVASAKYAAG